MKVTFGKFVLVDSARGMPSEKREIDASRQVEVQDYPEAEEIGIFDRGNKSKRHNFSSTREHATEDAAELFCELHDEQLPIKETLSVGGSFGGWKRTYEGAALVRVMSFTTGCRSWHTYEFVTGLSSK